MTKMLAVMAVAVAFLLCLPLGQGGAPAAAAEINILSYYVPGHVGDYWTYSYVKPSGPPPFTVTLSQVTSGPFSGEYRVGDFALVGKGADWRIADWDASGITVYETGFQGVFTPPTKINAVQPLETLVNVPFHGSLEDDPINYWLYRKWGSSLTVPAGTFNDVLLNLVFDEGQGPNSANTFFGLDPIEIPYGVTEATWFAAGVGEIQVANIDAATGDLVFLYQLTATSVPLPPSLVLLGSSLLGLIGCRKWSDG